MSDYYNSGRAEPPRLETYLNLDNLTDLRADSLWPGLEGLPRYQRLMADGFSGVQLTNDDPPPAGMTMPYCGLDRINTPSEADPIAAKHAARGDHCITVHAGWGLEDEAEVHRLVEAILAASARHHLPIFIETHRATITQDLWRTVQIVKYFPEVRFNGDFSHYYTGQEMVYGNWDEKLAFMAPIFARIGFLHGRIGSPGCMQVSITDDPTVRPAQAHGVVDFLAHFKALWIHSLCGFLRHAGQGDVLIFAPELLAGTYYYARKFPDAHGNLIEESDRYQQALLYVRIAQECFAAARCLVAENKDE